MTMSKSNNKSHKKARFLKCFEKFEQMKTHLQCLKF